jgi:hypothetical protein
MSNSTDDRIDRFKKMYEPEVKRQAEEAAQARAAKEANEELFLRVRGKWRESAQVIEGILRDLTRKAETLSPEFHFKYRDEKELSEKTVGRVRISGRLALKPVAIDLLLGTDGALYGYRLIEKFGAMIPDHGSRQKLNILGADKAQ